jgi:hypothetical protein
MSWDYIDPPDADRLFDVLSKLSDLKVGVFRGQGARWKHLKPSLHRALLRIDNVVDRVLIETESIETFRRHARSLLHFSELKYLHTIRDSLVLLQHYGAPTRLLDWTFSPWVAAYFACERGSEDGVIWAFNRAELLKTQTDLERRLEGKKREEFDRFSALEKAEDVLQWRDAAFQPNLHIRSFRYEFANPQMTAQQSLFTMSGTLDEGHERSIARILKQRGNTLRVVVRAKIMRTVQQRLFRMNVNALSLFPTTSGVGRHIAEAIKCDFPMGDRDLLWKAVSPETSRRSANDQKDDEA